jgi:hypothetical protein
MDPMGGTLEAVMLVSCALFAIAFLAVILIPEKGQQEDADWGRPRQHSRPPFAAVNLASLRVADIEGAGDLMTSIIPDGKARPPRASEDGR